VAANDASAKRARRLTALDSTFLYGESANNPLHIGSLLIFEGNIPFDDLVQHVDRRLHLLPRYRQRLAEVPFNLEHPMLEEDPDFRLENHVKRVQLTPNTTEAEAVERVLKEYHPIMDRACPLWELLSFEGWPGGHTGIVSKVHHALVDGVSGVELMKVLFDFRPDAPAPTPPEKEWKAGPLPTQLERVMAATRDLLVKQMDFVTDSGIELARDPLAVAQRSGRLLLSLTKLAQSALRPVVAAPWNAGAVTNARSLAWVRNPFSDYRDIRTAFGGTVNDVVLTVLTEGAARYLKRHGYSTDGAFRVGCPVNVRRSEEQIDLGNRVSMMFPMVSAAPMDPIERLKLVSEETEQIKAAELPQALERLTFLTELSPPSLMALLSRAGIFTLETAAAFMKVIGWKPRPGSLLLAPPLMSFIATNVPGVQVPQYLAGRRCLEQVGLLPLGGNLGYGVAILSYNQNLYFGMMAEPNLVPDIEFLKSCVQDSFDELRAAARKVLGAEPRDRELGASHLAQVQPRAAGSTAANP
jgi:diacylglycerol O-acyltransferase